MFSFFGKKNKLRAQDAYNVFESLLTSLNFKGYPEKSARTKGNWDPYYKNVGKKTANYNIKSVCDDVCFDFGATFLMDKETTVSIRVNLENLDLSYSKDGFAKLKATYNMFSIYQLSKSLCVSSTPKACANVDDVKKVIMDFYNDWNNSGLYPLLVKLNK